MYAIRTHCSVFSETCSDVLIDGSATLTIETSSTVMKNATQTSASACQRRGSGSMLGSITQRGGASRHSPDAARSRCRTGSSVRAPRPSLRVPTGTSGARAARGRSPPPRGVRAARAVSRRSRARRPRSARAPPPQCRRSASCRTRSSQARYRVRSLSRTRAWFSSASSPVRRRSRRRWWPASTTFECNSKRTSSPDETSSTSSTSKPSSFSRRRRSSRRWPSPSENTSSRVSSSHSSS